MVEITLVGSRVPADPWKVGAPGAAVHDSAGHGDRHGSGPLAPRELADQLGGTAGVRGVEFRVLEHRETAVVGFEHAEE